MKRLEFALDATARWNARVLIHRSGASSFLDMIRRALSFYKWYLDNVRDGGATLVLRKNGTDKQVEVIF